MSELAEFLADPGFSLDLAVKPLPDTVFREDLFTLVPSLGVNEFS